MRRVGVLALQGSFAEHEATLSWLGVVTTQVRRVEHLRDIDALVIPGGESTTVGKLMVLYHLDEAIKDLANKGMPLFGTCAGMILMAREVEGPPQPILNLMDIKIKRNAYGRQLDSFEAEFPVLSMGKKPYHGVFIRAPHFKSLSPQVTILAYCDGLPVAARQGKMLVSAFHPELTNDLRFHRYFLKKVCNYLHIQEGD